MYGKVTICGVDTSKLPRLKAKEAEELLQRAKQGDKCAEEKFIYANLRLVLSVVRRFMQRTDSPDDIFQVGCVGLIKAVKNFDASHNVRFSTYAVPMIIGEIRRFLRDDSSIRVSRSVRDLAYRAMQAREELSAQTQREVTNVMIAEKLGVDVFEVDSALEAVTEPVSIFEPVYNDGNDQIYVVDQIKDNSADDGSWTERLALRQALKKLDEREYNIIKLRYFLGKTQMEIAGDIGISQAQVSRIEKSALDRMRRMM